MCRSRPFPSCVTFPRPYTFNRAIVLGCMNGMRNASRQTIGSAGRRSGRIVAVSVAQEGGPQTENGTAMRSHLIERSVFGARPAGRPRPFTGRNAAGRRCGSKSRRSPSGSGRSRPSAGRTAKRRGREQRLRSWTSEIPFLRTVSLAVSFRKANYVYQMPLSMHLFAWQHATFRIAA